MRKKDLLFDSLKFILPCLYWLFLFKVFLARQATILSENFSQYSLVKFYLDNLRTGVYPLWNPFLLWGTADTITLLNIGPFNPLWLLTLFLNAIGLDFYSAYLTTTIVYFFIGQIGFYLLAKALLRDRLAAYAAFVLLTFSSMGLSMFDQYIMMLIWVPGVWFFFFFVSFIETWQKRFFVGTAFALMLILSTYLPFYFLTIFLTLLLFSLVLCLRRLRQILAGCQKFLRQNAGVFLFCVLAIALSILPTLQTYRSTLAQEIVVPFRQIEKEAVYNKGVTLASYAKTTDGGISARMFWQDLFSHLDQIEYGNDGFIYISLFAYLVLGLSIFNRLSLRAAMLFSLSLTLFLLSITSAAALHPFLFQQVFYFKLFRNLHYLMPFLLSVFVLFTAEQLRALFDVQIDSPLTRWLYLALTVAVHAGAGIFLTRQGNIIASSYTTIAGSLLFFLFYFAGWLKECRAVVFFCLLAVIILQPTEVFSRYHAQARHYTSEIIDKAIRVPFVSAQFSFLRPDFKDEQGRLRLTTDPQNYFNSHRISMTDSPGFFMPYEYGFPMFWSYFFDKNIPADVTRRYTRHKFFVYTRVRIVEAGQSDFSILEDALRRSLDVAFVSLSRKASDRSDLSSLLESDALSEQGQAMVISQDSSDLRVKHFDVNDLRLETNFTAEKFLVYNDSFDRRWQAFVNGQKVKVYRANLAFKGIRLPAGHNDVHFRYAPWGAEGLYFFLLAMFVGMLMYLLWLFYGATRFSRLPWDGRERIALQNV